jgi:hypothetical protein
VTQTKEIWAITRSFSHFCSHYFLSRSTSSRITIGNELSFRPSIQSHTRREKFKACGSWKAHIYSHHFLLLLYVLQEVSWVYFSNIANDQSSHARWCNFSTLMLHLFDLLQFKFTLFFYYEKCCFDFFCCARRKKSRRKLGLTMGLIYFQYFPLIHVVTLRFSRGIRFSTKI